MSSPIATERHARLFRNGRNQAVRIPREFELPGQKSVVRRRRPPDPGTGQKI